MPPEPLSSASSPTLPPGISRRGFLRDVTGGAAMIAVASVLPPGRARDYPQAAQDGARLYALSARQYATARAAAEALLVEVPVPASRVAERIDREVALVGDPVRSDVRTVLTVLDHATILGGHLRPFTALSPAERRDYMRGWATSRFDLRRAVFQATRAFVYFYAYIDDATRRITGFEGPWPERFPGIPATPVDFGEVT